MRVIPVLDLLAGRAVLARPGGGPRDRYAPPTRSVLVPEEWAGDAPTLALAFRQRLGCDEWYVADLDAIMGRAPQHAVVAALARLGSRLLIDGAVTTGPRAEQLVAAGATRVVVGLETLPSFVTLREIVRAVGGRHVVFSLDLRAGQAVTAPGAPHRGTAPQLARLAVAAGVAGVLVLDFARIGTGEGPDVALLAELRRAHPGVELLAGGGVGSARQLGQLEDAGCDAALVATALHDGRITRRDIGGGAHASNSR